MWEYSGGRDPTHGIRDGFVENHSLARVLAGMFKGEERDFDRQPQHDGFDHEAHPSSDFFFLTASSFYLKNRVYISLIRFLLHLIKTRVNGSLGHTPWHLNWVTRTVNVTSV